MTLSRLGFIGLGQMGGPMAANIAANGFDLIVYDRAGTELRAPAGAVTNGGGTPVDGLVRLADIGLAVNEIAHLLVRV